jgi:hypothetical protein
MNQQQHNARASSDGARTKHDGRPSAASGNGAGARHEGLRDVLATPLRWLRKMFASASRWVRRRLKFSPSAILDMLRRASKGRGFGFWWLAVTLLLAVVVGLLVAALLTPVTGILAGLAVAVWFLIRKSTGGSRAGRGSAATA